MKNSRWIWAALLLVGLIACIPTAASVPGTPSLVSKVHADVNSEGLTFISVEVRNTGNASFPTDQPFLGIMELRDTHDELRVRTQTYCPCGELEPGGITFPTNWKGKLAIGSYRLIWAAPNHGAVDLEFELTSHEGRLMLIQHNRAEYPANRVWELVQEKDFGGATLMVELAKTDLSKFLSVKPETVRVQSVEHEPGSNSRCIIDLTVANRIYQYRCEGDQIVRVTR